MDYCGFVWYFDFLCGTQAVVLTKRPQIAEASSLLDPGVLDLLVAQISTLSAVYHQPPETFVPKLRRGQAQQAAERLKQLKEQNRAQTDEYVAKLARAKNPPPKFKTTM